MPLDFPLPRVIAHRGESGLAPENTLAAFELAASNGASWVELDVNISSDHIPFVHHDHSLERCTDGQGHLNLQTGQVLETLDAGSWFDASFKGEALPTLAAVMRLLAERKMGLNLEIKPVAGLEDPTANAICDDVLSHWPQELPLLLSSFSESALLQAARIMPDIARGCLVGAIPPDWQARMQTLGCDTLHCAAGHLDEKTAAQVKSAGFGLLCYTVNDTETAQRLFSWGVDSIFTDYPSRLLPQISS